MKHINWIVIITTLTTAQITKPMEVACQPQAEQASLDTIPQNAIEEVCRYLPLKDIASLKKVCRSLYQNAWDHERVLCFDERDIISMIPKNFGVLGNVQFKAIPSDALAAGIGVANKKLNNCRNHISLDLSSLGLTELPPEIQSFKNLRMLRLSYNNLKQEAIAKLGDWLPNLEELLLDFDNLTGLPAKICALTQLRILNIRSNKLSPAAVAKLCALINLQVLSLQANELRELPAEIINLINLRVLDLTGNLLSPIVIASLCNIPKLEALSLANNDLIELVAEIGDLKHIKILGSVEFL